MHAGNIHSVMQVNIYEFYHSQNPKEYKILGVVMVKPVSSSGTPKKPLQLCSKWNDSGSGRYGSLIH
jgi:hypothetical protein